MRELHATHGAYVRVVAVAALAFFLNATSAPITRAQGRGGDVATADARARPTTKPSVEPKYKDYRGVALGATADEVRSKLGKPESHDEKSDLFELGKNETAVVYYDADHKARAVVVTYSGSGDAPTPLAVFGEDVPAGPDGTVSKMVRYDDAGFWVSYNKATGDNPYVIVTIQKSQ